MSTIPLMVSRRIRRMTAAVVSLRLRRTLPHCRLRPPSCVLSSPPPSNNNKVANNNNHNALPPASTPRISTERHSSPSQRRRQGGWVSEAELMMVRGPSEMDAAKPGDAESSGDEGGVVTRRLVIGLALTAATVAFSLVPSFWTRPKPSKPLYFYVVPLVEVQERLASLQQIATEGQWGTLKTELKRLTSLPLDIRSNLDSAAAYLEEKEAYERATELSKSILEYLDQVDFSKYFENLGTASFTQEKEFKDFSLKSLKAAGELLKQFMKLLPVDVVSAAQEQAAARTASMLAIQ
eukprot:jgi/Chlat1/414/Chrsp10S00056